MNPLNKDPEIVPGVTMSDIIWTAVNLDPAGVAAQMTKMNMLPPDNTPETLGNMLIKFQDIFGFTTLCNTILFHAPAENPQAANYAEAQQLKAHVEQITKALQTGQTL